MRRRTGRRTELKSGTEMAEIIAKELENADYGDVYGIYCIVVALGVITEDDVECQSK